MYSCNGKASLLQSSVSHDHSEIVLIWWWFGAQETFYYIESNCL